MEKSREEMLKDLHSIKGSIVTESGYFDTGVEFRVLNNTAGTFCSYGGSDSISGPYCMNEVQANTVKKFIDLKIDDIDYDRLEVDGSGIFELFDDYEEDLDVDPNYFNEKEKMSLADVDEEELSIFFKLVSQGYSPNTNYYCFTDLFDDNTSIYETKEDAEDHLMSYADESEGKAWEDMSDAELEEWYEFYLIHKDD